jgi:hypothetical protein
LRWLRGQCRTVELAQPAMANFEHASRRSTSAVQASPAARNGSVMPFRPKIAPRTPSAMATGCTPLTLASEDLITGVEVDHGLQVRALLRRRQLIGAERIGCGASLRSLCLSRRTSGASSLRRLFIVSSAPSSYSALNFVERAPAVKTLPVRKLSWRCD